MSTTPVQVPDRVTREVKRLLLLVALGGLAILAALAVAGLYLSRVHRFQQRVLSSIEEVGSEGVDRADLQAWVRARLFASDFPRLEAMARELRESRDTYPNGAWKLTVFYGAFGEVDGSSPFDWDQALAQAEIWTRSHPDSITARILLAEMWIAYAWQADTSGQPQPDTEQAAEFLERLKKADAAILEATELEAYCPHLAATELRLAVSARWPREAEARIFAEAVASEPDYQPSYGLHLYYLEAFREGQPGEWQRAAEAMAKPPGGPERYAYVVWFRGQPGQPRLDGVSWPILKDGFQRLVASHPDSLELKSAYCFFAFRFKDQPETRRLLDEIGFRMQTTVWPNRSEFAQAHRWATFEDSERTRDPVARWFARLWRN